MKKQSNVTSPKAYDNSITEPKDNEMSDKEFESLFFINNDFKEVKTRTSQI
jgi:hypothetical protein